jgi:hypothetical protein
MDYSAFSSVDFNSPSMEQQTQGLNDYHKEQ